MTTNQTLTRVYRGPTPIDVRAWYAGDAEGMAGDGWRPGAEAWSRDGGQFVLTVTYLRPAPSSRGLNLSRRSSVAVAAIGLVLATAIGTVAVRPASSPAQDAAPRARSTEPVVALASPSLVRPAQTTTAAPTISAAPIISPAPTTTPAPTITPASTPSPDPTARPTPRPSEEPTPAPTPAPTAEPTTARTLSATPRTTTEARTRVSFRTFGSGVWTVGGDIPAGTYRTRERADTCYWARLSGTGGSLEEIISNENIQGYGVVTIEPADVAFETSGCPEWSSDLSRVTPAETTFGDGTFIVGTDLEPGTYGAAGDDVCYWARLSGFGGSLDEILEAGTPLGPATVTIDADDAGFSSRGCGSWTRL